MKYVIYIFLSLVFLGCSGDNGVQPKSTIDIAEEMETIDIEKAKESIRSQLQEGDDLKFYTSQDKKDLFVLVDHRFLTTLYNYDATKYPPVKRDIVAEYPDNHIIDVAVLPNGKLLYQQITPVSLTLIHIYDYILKRDIAKYSIWYEYLEGSNEDQKRKLYMNPDLKSFTVAGVIVDISDLYNETPFQNRKMYRDDDLNVVVDGVNGLIWQDDTSVQSNNYTLDEAILSCQQKEPQNSWRIPTLKDMHKLMTQQEKLFSLFIFQDSDEDSYTTYWIANKKAPQHYGTYGMHSINFVKKSKYIDITFEDTKNIASFSTHVRCVKDF